MYPSIEKEEIMKIVNRKIEDKFGIDKVSETLISTSNLILNEDHFIFDNIVYRQKEVCQWDHRYQAFWLR